MVKKAMAVSMLTVLAFIFSGVNVAHGQIVAITENDIVEVIPVPFTFDIRLFHLNGEEIPRDGIIEIRPASTRDVRLYTAGTSHTNVTAIIPEGTIISPGDTIGALLPGRTVGVVEPHQMIGERLELHYSGRNQSFNYFPVTLPALDIVTGMPVQIPVFIAVSVPVDGILTLSVPRTTMDTVVQDVVVVQLGTTILGNTFFSSTFPLRVRITNAGNARDDGNSGGTCNVAGFGFLALLLLPPVFLWKKRK